MEIYNDPNIRIELKNKNLSQEEILSIMFWLMTMCGHTIDIALDNLEDEEMYLENLNS